MKIVLTGGTGMLGRTLQDAFALQRPDVEMLAPTRRELNLLSSLEVHDYIAAAKPDLILHAGARVGGIQANINEPALFLYENAVISLNVIHASASAGVQDLIYFGSSCMYPRDYAERLKESDLLAAPLEPTNEGYGLAKILGAKLCEYYNRQIGTRYRVFTLCNLYGRYDRFDIVRSHLLPALLMKIHHAKVTGQAEVSVWGTGEARREFLYCDDLASFVAESAGHTGALPEYLNLGYGTDFSVLEYYQMGMQVVGLDGKLLTEKDKPAGMSFKLLDSSRARQWGWNPKTTPVEGMRKTYEYYLRIK